MMPPNLQELEMLYGMTKDGASIDCTELAAYVTTHCDRETYPVVKVKFYGFGDHIPAWCDTRKDERMEHLADAVWEWVAEQFWTEAKVIAARYGYSVIQIGKGGGWLAVDGIGLPDDWTTEVLGADGDYHPQLDPEKFFAWFHFEREILNLLTTVPHDIAEEFEYRKAELAENPQGVWIYA